MTRKFTASLRMNGTCWKVGREVALSQAEQRGSVGAVGTDGDDISSFVNDGRGRGCGARAMGGNVPGVLARVVRLCVRGFVRKLRGAVGLFALRGSKTEFSVTL